MADYLAVDIGASSGRHILGRMEGGRLTLEEVYRFPNGAALRDGVLCWDYEALLNHIVEGMSRCAALGRVPESMGIDTWGVDFLLLDGAGAPVGPPAAYRDARTRGMDARVAERVDEAALYGRTGIQKQSFNTVYQLMACRALLPRARRLLMVPDYLHWRLTGRAVQEYTNATTTALVNARTREWDGELLDALGYPRRLFGPLSPPGTAVGELLPQVARRAGFTCRVVLPPTHDTACAVLGAPLEEGQLFLSSGTWSLLGAERTAPLTTPESRAANFTNEGGYGGSYRYLKNSMGLWMIQQVRRELGDAWDFPALARLAEENGAFSSAVDPEDPRFLAPDSMIAALRGACREGGRPVPETPGELAQTVFRSLALGYAAAAEELRALTGEAYTGIALVGGGSRNGYLNRLAARATGLRVRAGPAEGTALGNLVCQMIAAGELRHVRHARQVIRESFTIEEVPP